MMKKLFFAFLAAIMSLGVGALEIPIYGDVQFSYYYAMLDGSPATPDEQGYEGRANYTFAYNSELGIAMLTKVDGSSYWAPLGTTTLTLPTSVTINGTSHRVVGIYSPSYTIKVFQNDATGLTGLIIPEGYEFISGSELINLSYITSLTLPASLKWISHNALYLCTRLESLTLADNPNEVLHIEGGTSGHGLCSDLNLKDVTIGRNVEFYSSFFGGSSLPCSYSLTSATVTGAMTVMPDYFFADQLTLAHVTIQEGITKIPYKAFSNCRKLEAIEVPNSVETIEDLAFDGDTTLNTINLGSGVKHIGYYAFGDCRNVTELTLPTNLETIHETAFTDMTGVKTLVVEDCETQLWIQGFRAFEKGLFKDFAEGFTCHYGRNFYVDGDEQVMYANAPLIGTKVGKVVMSDYVTELHEKEFSYCHSLTSVTPSKNLTKIPKYAFRECDKLPSFSVPDKVTLIDEDAFKNDTALATIDLGTGVKYIGYGAFNNCSKIAELTLPANIDTIEVHAFEYMTGVKKLYIEDSATPLVVSGYRNTPSLFTDFAEGFTCYMGRNFDRENTGWGPPLRLSKVGELTLGMAVDQLLNYEFAYCTSLTKITSTSTVPPQCPSADVFADVDKNIPVYVPKTAIDAYKDATGWKEFFNIKAIALRGDVDGNGGVDIGDINIVINLMLGKMGQDGVDGADLDGNGQIDIGDINAIINIMLGK